MKSPGSPGAGAGVGRKELDSDGRPPTSEALLKCRPQSSSHWRAVGKERAAGGQASRHPRRSTLFVLIDSPSWVLVLTLPLTTSVALGKGPDPVNLSFLFWPELEHPAWAPGGHGSTITPIFLHSSDASATATRIHVTSRMGPAARVRTTRRRAPARAAPPVTAETATSTRCGRRSELRAKGPTRPRGQSCEGAARPRQDRQCGSDVCGHGIRSARSTVSEPQSVSGPRQ